MKFLKFFILFAFIILTCLPIISGTCLDCISSLFDKTKPIPKVEFKNSDCHCRLKSSSRIVKGEIAEPNLVPWLVSIANRNGKHLCAGTIVNRISILTSTSCILGIDQEDLRIRVGLHKLNDPDIEKKTYRVRKIYDIDLLKSNFYPGNIAIISLLTAIELKKDEVELGCLNLEESKEYNKFTYAGWGSEEIIENEIYNQLEFSNELKVATLGHSKSNCEDFYICSDYYENNGDSLCQGDLGGPLMETINGRTSVEGVASYLFKDKADRAITKECIGKAFFSKLSFSDHSDWLKKILKEDYCKI